MKANKHKDAIIKALEETYGSPRLGNKEDPLDELIYIKLSQQTNEPKFQSMYEDLHRRFPNWHGLVEAPQEELEEILRPGGLHRRRARDIKAMVKEIVEDQGALDLSWLADLPASDAIDYLESLPGVGIKMAYCVAMYSLGHHILPVDIHVQRVSERLGLLPHGLSDEEKHEYLNELIPEASRYSYHVNCVSHGRKVCRKDPNCEICCVNRYCAVYQAKS
jgi:endonuclease-3